MKILIKFKYQFGSIDFVADELDIAADVFEGFSESSWRKFYAGRFHTLRIKSIPTGTFLPVSTRGQLCYTIVDADGMSVSGFYDAEFRGYSNDGIAEFRGEKLEFAA